VKKSFITFITALSVPVLVLQGALTSMLSEHEYKDAIIESALSTQLPTTDSAISAEADNFDEQALQKVHEGHYEEAISITLAGLKKFPRDFTLQARLASLLGDCSEITPAPLKDRMVTRAKQLFDRLAQEVAEQPKATMYSFKNEYFFRFGMYREQYELGLSRVADYWGTDEWKRCKWGYYSQGVGASRYAKKLLEDGNASLATEYAQKALVSWAQYFTYSNDYYNAYVHYALALGILGYTEEMMRALHQSASLIKENLDYFEFKEVIDFIAGIKIYRPRTLKTTNPGYSHSQVYEREV